MNTFVPGTCIPVKSPDELYADLGRNVSIAIVVSAWNFHTEIEAKIKSAGFANAYVVALAGTVGATHSVAIVRDLVQPADVAHCTSSRQRSIRLKAT